MVINPKIISILDERKISRDEALIYLLSIYFDIKASCLSQYVITKVNGIGIVSRDYKTGNVEWNIPLFVEQGSNIKKRGRMLGLIQEENWEWINDYRQMFNDLRQGAGGEPRTVLSKMKRIFADNPFLTKELVLEAAKAYLSEFDPNDKKNLIYLQRADYFISKEYKENGKIITKSRLLQYVDIKRKRDIQIKIIK